MDMNKRVFVLLGVVLFGGGCWGELDPSYQFGGGDLAKTQVDGSSDAAVRPDISVRHDIGASNDINMVVADLSSLDGALVTDIGGADLPAALDMATLDGAASADLSGSDLAAVDLATTADLADGGGDGGDMAQVIVVMPDLAKQPMSDLATNSDFAVALDDLSVSSDFAVLRDLANPPSVDFAVERDSAVPLDLATTPTSDLTTAPRDLATTSDLTIPPGTCTDGIRNRDETDVDCGGSCQPCAFGNLCQVFTDCQKPLACDTGRCAPGKYAFGECPSENNAPPVQSCVETCAQKYGGMTANWRCGTDGTGPSGKAWGFWQSDVKALPATECAGGNTPENDDFVFGTTYECGVRDCAFSACVNAGCAAATNYCYQQ